MKKNVHIWGFSKLRIHMRDVGSMYVGNYRYVMGYIFIQVSFSHSEYIGYIEGLKNMFFRYFLKITYYPLKIFFMEKFSARFLRAHTANQVQYTMYEITAML